MTRRLFAFLPLAAALLLVPGARLPVEACCPAPREGQQVLNADQTLVILWDAERKIEHFIRKATFKSEAQDFGFIVPSPTQPELSESGGEAFSLLSRLTEPEIVRQPRPRRGGGLGCGGVRATKTAAPEGAMLSEPEVRVLEEKLVAGFKATVLEADTAAVLMEWLKANGYAFSPEVEAWAAPYVEQKWKLTALKVAAADTQSGPRSLEAPALRMSFQTDRPLFPYREPDSKAATAALDTRYRLLRIFFVGEARYAGALTPEEAWTGRAAWSNPLKPEQRADLLEKLKLPAETGPATFWLTEFEDPWPYKLAPSDLYFSKAGKQATLKRPPIIEYYDSPWPDDAILYVIGVGIVLGGIVAVRRMRRAKA
ncbi:MAG: DUF2330 domain-containing protein [Planctomycetota bacterium]|nr:DUF2330 domain-containing protein [Planctomycetota bacterium]